MRLSYEGNSLQEFFGLFWTYWTIVNIAETVRLLPSELASEEHLGNTGTSL